MIVESKIRTTRSDRCYLCGSEGKRIYSGLMDRLHQRSQLWDLIRCLNPECGLVWLDPTPIKEDLHNAYDDYYTHDSSSGRSRMLYTIIRGIYRAFNFVPSRIFGLYRAKAQVESMFLAGKMPGTLLDVGCGDGGFLNKMRSSGWAVEGVDVDKDAADFALKKFGIKVHIGELIDAHFPGDYFDAITLKHVIEHVYDPVSLLEECKRILKPGGTIVLVAPNMDSLGSKKFKVNWRDLDPPRHLYVFSPISIRLCAEKAGLSVQKIITSAANSELVFLGSFDIERAGRHDLRKFPVIANALKAWFYQYSELFSMRTDPYLGEELVLIAGK